MNAAEPGFYPDPANPGQLRYWDGVRWTAQHAGASGAGNSAGVRAERALVGGGPAARKAPSEGHRWTFFVLATVFVGAFIATFVGPAGWQPRELPEWVTAEWDEYGRRVFPADVELSAELSELLVPIDRAEQVLVRFGEASDEPTMAALEMLAAGMFTGEAGGGLEEIQAVEALAREAREDLRAPLAALTPLTVGEDLAPLRRAYLDHSGAWADALDRLADDAAGLLLEQ